MVEDGSIWYDSYNYGTGPNNPQARVLRVEGDVDENGYVRATVVGGHAATPLSLGRATRVKADRFGMTGGLQPANDATLEAILPQFKEAHPERQANPKKGKA